MIAKIKSYFAYIYGLLLTSKYFVFIVFMYQMMKMSYSLFVTGSKLRIGKVDEIMVLHVDPKLLQTGAFMEQVQNIAKVIARPYNSLYGTDPIVVILPFGSTIHAVNMEGFFELLNPDQRRMLKKQLQKIPLIETFQNLEDLKDK